MVKKTKKQRKKIYAYLAVFLLSMGFLMIGLLAYDTYALASAEIKSIPTYDEQGRYQGTYTPLADTVLLSPFDIGISDYGHLDQSQYYYLQSSPQYISPYDDTWVFQEVFHNREDVGVIAVQVYKSTGTVSNLVMGLDKRDQPGQYYENWQYYEIINTQSWPTGWGIYDLEVDYISGGEKDPFPVGRMQEVKFLIGATGSYEPIGVGVAFPDPYTRGDLRYNIVGQPKVTKSGFECDMTFYTRTVGDEADPPTISISFSMLITGTVCLIGGALSTSKYYLVI